MSSGAGEAGGAGGLDLNCDTATVFDNHEAAVEGLDDALVSTKGEVFERERVETMEAGGDEKKECERGVADWENGMVGNGERSGGSELGGACKDGVVGTVRREAGIESHGRKLLEVDSGEKGSLEHVSVSTVGFEDVEASSQAMDVGDGSGGDGKQGADVDTEVVVGTYEVPLSVLFGGRGADDERLERSSILRREHVEVQVNFVDGGGEFADGHDERKVEGEFHGTKLLEMDTWEKVTADLVIVSAEEFEAVGASNQAVNLGDDSGGDQKQGIDVNAEKMVIDGQLCPGEREAEVISDSVKFLEVEKGDKGSTELVAVSTEGFEPVEASSHAVTLHDGSGGDEKRGTDLDAKLDLGENETAKLVGISTVGFEAVQGSSQAMELGDGSGGDQKQDTDENTESMVGTNEDSIPVIAGGAGAEGERLEVSSIVREEKVEVDLMDGGVQVIDGQLGHEERKTEGKSHGMKLLEVHAGERKSTDLVGVSIEEFEDVGASNQAVNSGHGFGGDQKQGIDVDVEGIVIDGQLGLGERDAEVKSHSGKFLEVDKRDEGNAELVAVSSEGFQPVEASSHSMDFQYESVGDQKRGTDIDAEGVVIDRELGSGKREAEIESHCSKLFKVDYLVKRSTDLGTVSTEGFEPAQACSQAMNLGDGSCDDQRLGTDFDAESIVGINEDSVTVSVGSGGKILEVDCEEKRSAELVAVSAEGFEPVKASSQAKNLLDRSCDDQRLGTEVDADGMIEINEVSVAISVGSGGPMVERSTGSLALREEQVEVNGSGQVVDGKLDTGRGEAEFKSYSGRCMEVDMREKGSVKLVAASAERSEAVEASSQAIDLGDESVGDQKRGTDVDTKGMVGTDEGSLAVLFGGGGHEGERLEGSLFLTEQDEVQVDLVDGSDQAVDGKLGPGERKSEVDSHEGTLLEVDTGQKETADLVAVSAEGFEAIEASKQAMNSGDGSGSDRIQGIDVDGEGMVIDGQLVPGERDDEVKSHSNKLLEVDKREKGSAELVAVSTEIFEPVEASSQPMDFGDGSDGDQKRGTDVNTEGVAIGSELSHGKRKVEVESHGRKFLKVVKGNNGSEELPAVSIEGFVPVKASSQAMDLVDGSGGDQWLETDVDAEAMVRTDEDSVATSVASGTPEDARLEGSLVLRKEHVDVQGNLVDGSGEVVDGELGTVKSEAEIKSYGERCMEVDMGEKGSTKLVVTSAERSEAVETSSHAMDLGDGLDGDSEGVVGNEDSVIVSVVGGAPGNERLEGSLTLGKEQVEVMVHLVDGFGQVVDSGMASREKENELESHGGKLLEVELEEEKKELIALSAKRFEIVEVSCPAMDLGHRSNGDQTQGIDVNAKGMVDTSDDSAAVSVGRGGCEDERLEESSVLGIEHVEVLQKSVDGCGQVADSQLMHGEWKPVVESHGGKLLKVESGAKPGAELFAISAGEGIEVVEACSDAMDLEDGSGSDQKLGPDLDAQYMVGANEDSINVSGADGGPEDESLEGSSLLGKEHTEIPEDLVCGYDQVLDGEFGPVKSEAEVEPRSEKLLEVDAGQKGSAVLASIPAGGSDAVEASSQVMDLEDEYSSEQKQGTNSDAEGMFRTDENYVAVSVDGGGPEDEMLEGSSNIVNEEAEVGEETNGTRSAVKHLTHSMNTEGAGNDAMMHAAQFQTEYGSDQRQGTDLGVAAILGGIEEAPLAVSVGGREPEDERLETSDKKQVDVGVDNSESGMLRENLAYPENIGCDGVDAMRNTGHVKDPVDSKHVKDLVSREGFGGDHRSESYVETDPEPLVVAVAHQGTESQGLKGVPRSNDEQVEAKYCNDGSQMMERAAHSQKSGDSMNVDVVCDLVEEHPDEREGSIVGDNGHYRNEVDSEFSAGEENMMEKGLASLPECVEVAHDSMEHALDVGDPGGDDYHHETVVTYKKHEDISLGTFQGAVLEMMGGESGIGLHSTVGSKRVEVRAQVSYVENDQKIYNENNTVAGETVQRQDSLPITEEQDSGLHQVDGDMKSTISGVTIDCDVARTGMTLDAAVNAEAWSSDEHTAVDNIVDKGDVLEGNGSVMSVMSAELQNGNPQLNFHYQNQKKDSSSSMILCRDEAHTAGPHSLGNFFMERGYPIMEDSNSLLGISIPESSVVLENLIVTPQWNEPSSGCQHVQSPNVPSREHEELEPEQGTSAFESALHVVDEATDCSQSLQGGTHEHLKESESQSEERNNANTESASTSQQATYYLSFPEKEGFSTPDLVWGKVKSHPWWPGQIFDFSGASELALKYQKKDCFLVAYFGDKTFAWCEESRLKPFQLYFSQMEKQTSSDSFLRAVHDILVEISRRIELAMTCLCIPEETYADIKYQKVENAGVRGKISSSVFDRYEVVNFFHPDKLLEYVRALGQLPTGGADRLELTIALAQLKAFYLSKGYTELPAFTIGSGLVEHDFEIPSSMNKNLNEVDLEHSATLSDLFSAKGKLRGRDGTLGKQKHIVEDGRKQKSLSELMQEETTFLLVNDCENGSEVQDDEDCVSSGNKRKAIDYVSTDIGRSKTKKINSLADKETKLPSPTSNSSFKVGEFISRAASKLTSGQPIRKCHGETSEWCLSKTDDWSIDYMNIDDFLDVPFDNPKLQIDISGDYPPSNEMLSKLCLAARNPMKGYNFSSIVVSFFSAFRNVLVSNFSIEMNRTEKPKAKRGRKKKIISDLELPDTSTPDYMKDSYWSDMILPEKDAILNPPKRRGRKKRKFTDESSPLQMLNSPSDCEQKLHIGTMCPHVKHILTAERPIISVEEKIVDERTPTAVILYFNCSNSLPSDMDLIRIFSRYGPLKEEETYIERKNNSAMVVFKKRADAEMAFSSAGKFSTFGPALLSYRLRHFSSKPSPVNTLKGEENVQPIKDGNLGILAEPGSQGALDEKLCEAVGEESSIFVQSQGHLEPVLDMSPPVRFEDVNRGPSYFVQTQGDTGNTHVEIGGKFSELVQCQVGDVVVSSSTQANTAWKEPSDEDVPGQMETGAVSDHLLLESSNQELSHFDIDSGNVQVETVCQDSSGSVVGHVKAGVISDISVTEVGGEKSSGFLLDKAETIEVSHTANVRSLDQELCDPASVLVKATTGVKSTIQVAVTGVDSLADQLENGTVLEQTSPPDQPGETECSGSPPALVGTGTSNESLVTTDVQSMEKELSNFVQGNEDIGVDSRATEIQDASVSKESFEGQKKESSDSDLAEVKIGNV